MSAIDPKGPSQPTTNDAYTTSGNPVTHEPAESLAAKRKEQAAADSEPVETRIPREQSNPEDAKPSALGQGIRGAGSGEEARGETVESVGRHKELDAEQMAAPGEGKVYNAVEGYGPEGKPGSGGSQPDLAADLDRKKAEQAPLRHKIEDERKRNVDVGGVLGQSGPPASTVD